MKRQNEDALEAYIQEKRKVKRCTYQSKKEVQEQFRRKMNQDMNGNRKLFCKRAIKRMEEKWKIKDGNGRLVLEEIEVRMIWKEHFEDLYNVDT